MTKGKLIIDLDYGVSLWPGYPPWRITIGFSDQTVDLKFISLRELEHYINALTKLQEFINGN